MKKDFIASKIEALQDGSQYVLVAFTARNKPKSAGGGGNSYPQSPFGNSGEAIPFTSPEDLMKNLPKAMSNMFGAGGGLIAEPMLEEQKKQIDAVKNSCIVLVVSSSRIMAQSPSADTRNWRICTYVQMLAFLGRKNPIEEGN